MQALSLIEHKTYIENRHQSKLEEEKKQLAVIKVQRRQAHEGKIKKAREDLNEKIELVVN